MMRLLMKKNIEMASWIAAIISAVIAIYFLTNNVPNIQKNLVEGKSNNIINNNKGEINIEN